MPSIVGRVMERVVDHSVALLINFTGRSGKLGFKSLKLCRIVIGKN
jgi:hypothetical protein